MQARLLPSPALLLLTAAGCGEPVSNDIFLADLDFVAALPAADRLEMDLRASDDEIALTDDDSLDLRSLSLLLAADLAGNTSDALATVDLVRQGPPAERGTNSRHWGPFDVGVDGRLVTLDMTRIGERTYPWTFDWSELDGSNVHTFFAGEHFAGATVGEGDGSFRYDFTEAAALNGEFGAGSLEVDYDLREGRELSLSLVGYQLDADAIPLELGAWFQEDGDVRDFEFAVDQEGALDGLSSLSLRTRVLAEVGGRCDATAVAEDGTVDVLSQCWDRVGTIVWQTDDLGLYDEVGSESDCAWPEASTVEHL